MPNSGCSRRPVDEARAKPLQHRHQRARHRSGADEADDAATQFAAALDRPGVERPAPARPAGAVKAGEVAQRRQHQHDRRFGDRWRVGPRHVGDGDAARPRRREVDRVDPDPQLLDQPQFWRRGDDFGGHRF
jgi:hypothetical protein